MCNKTVSKDPFMLKYCLDKYKTQERMCDNAVDACLQVLVSYKKIIKRLDDALFTNDYIIFINEDSGNVTYFVRDMDIISVDLNNINLDDAYFDKDNPKSIIAVRLMAWCNRLKQRKSCKKI